MGRKRATSRSWETSVTRQEHEIVLLFKHPDNIKELISNKVHLSLVFSSNKEELLSQEPSLKFVSSKFIIFDEGISFGFFHQNIHLWSAEKQQLLNVYHSDIFLQISTCYDGSESFIQNVAQPGYPLIFLTD